MKQSTGIQYTLTSTLLGKLCWTALILHGIDWARCWKQSSGILVHPDKIVSDCLHIYDVNLPFHHITKVLCWIEIRRPQRLFEYNDLAVTLKKIVSDDLSFVTRHNIIIRKWVHCDHKYSGRLWRLNDVQLLQSGSKCKKITKQFGHSHLNSGINKAFSTCSLLVIFFWIILCNL